MFQLKIYATHFVLMAALCEIWNLSLRQNNQSFSYNDLVCRYLLLWNMETTSNLKLVDINYYNDEWVAWIWLGSLYSKWMNEFDELPWPKVVSGPWFNCDYLPCEQFVDINKLKPNISIKQTWRQNFFSYARHSFSFLNNLLFNQLFAVLFQSLTLLFVKLAICSFKCLSLRLCAFFVTIVDIINVLKGVYSSLLLRLFGHTRWGAIERIIYAIIELGRDGLTSENAIVWGCVRICVCVCVSYWRFSHARTCVI